MSINKILFKKIILTLLLLVIARMGIFIPIPGIDHDAFYNGVGKNALINFLNIFSGGGFSTIGVFALGIVPYINSSLIIQLLTKTIPSLENLQKEEGEKGRQKINQITRYLALIWAIIQSIGICIWIKPYVFYWNFNFIIEVIISLSTGSMIVMWFSEIITEKGIGNGASLLIFQNIISGIPQNLKSSIPNNNTIVFNQGLMLIPLFISMLVITILVQEGIRKINIVSARQLIKQNEIDPQSYLPLKLNQGGVMPIVFASASMALPSYLQSLIPNPQLKELINLCINNSIIYIMLYGILIMFFSYFYSSLVLNTEDLSSNLKKMGASIPNIRPGDDTNQYLNKVLKRLTFLGALFLFSVALVPSVIAQITNINSFKGFGATSLLILVGVAIDTAKQIQTYIISEKYESLMK
uniref:Protein translocase subunit SecY n=1 Tax=Helminthora furcellata TaxID=1884666 RepID=A0A1G4NZH2_9FLOR|nr:SecY-type transporter protein [Helminthora furcellata]SCW21197.1 SecY-type transporter protein [Helminthora furcellata]SCW24057.1 SecY-type transporter protein [Helminthora furcellata]